MNVQAEVSLYPLRTSDLGHPIESFLGELKAADLLVRQGSVSSTVSGDADEVFAVGASFQGRRHQLPGCVGPQGLKRMPIMQSGRSKQ